MEAFLFSVYSPRARRNNLFLETPWTAISARNNQGMSHAARLSWVDFNSEQKETEVDNWRSRKHDAQGMVRRTAINQSGDEKTGYLTPSI